MEKLPVELVEQIIAHVYEDVGHQQREWFAGTRYVCRLFSRLIRPHAFSVLDVFPQSPKALARLVLLCQLPEIRSIVKNIELHLEFDDDEVMFEPDPVAQDICRCLARLDLPDYLEEAIAPQLAKGSADALAAAAVAFVDRPVIMEMGTFDMMAGSLTSWMIRTKCFRSAHQVGSFQTLRHVTLGGLDPTEPLRLDHWSFLLRLPHLKSFDGMGLEGISVLLVPTDRRDFKHNFNNIIPATPQLETLKIRLSHLDMDVINRLICSAAALKFLSCQMKQPAYSSSEPFYFFSILAIGALLRQVNPPLETLCLAPPGYATPGMHHEFPFGDCATFTRLRELIITEWSIFGMPHTTFPDLWDHTRPLPYGNRTWNLVDVLPRSLELLSILEDTTAPLNQDTGYMRTSEAQCQRLVDARKRKFPNLKTVMLQRENRVPKAQQMIDTMTSREWRAQPRGFRWFKSLPMLGDYERQAYVDGMTTMQMDFDGLRTFPGWSAVGRQNDSSGVSPG